MSTKPSLSPEYGSGLKDVAIGDVVVATKVYGYGSGKSEESFRPRPDVGNSSYAMGQRAIAESKKQDWFKRIGERPMPEPRVLVGPIAAGEAVLASTSSALYQLLKENYGDALAVEMEGWGFLDATHRNEHVLSLIVRGISDLIDGKTEADSAGSQRLAALNASAFALEVLSKFRQGNTSMAVIGVGGRPPDGVVNESEPALHVVDAMHRSGFTTITKAIRAANPGDEIVVRSGLYEESLLIEKPLEIVGEGDASGIVIQSRDRHTVIFNAALGRLANLTVRQIGDGDRYAVDIVRGRFEVERCDISSQGNACVAIRDGADPHLRYNQIHSGEWIGILIQDHGQGTLEFNDIFDHVDGGIYIKKESNPTVRNNYISRCKTGVRISEAARGLLEDNSVYENDVLGIEIIGGADPRVRRNRIRNNRGSGVSVHDNGQGRLSDNTIIDNAGSGVTIDPGGWPIVSSNRRNRNGDFAISVRSNPSDSGSCEARDNDLRDNTRGAWQIAPDSRNRVHRERNKE